MFKKLLPASSFTYDFRARQLAVRPRACARRLVRRKAWRRHQQKNADENDRYDHADRIDFDRLPVHL